MTVVHAASLVHKLFPPTAAAAVQDACGSDLENGSNEHCLEKAVRVYAEEVRRAPAQALPRADGDGASPNSQAEGVASKLARAVLARAVTVFGSVTVPVVLVLVPTRTRTRRPRPYS